ncbi:MULTISPECIES: dipeptidase [unclassified Sphingopyxis]|uniref:dipeptidase n=1 Tax=unclassified Sphingopyxis TaxID=2614943 RepID=UPI001EE73C9C|nr:MULTISPECIES: membrane dipeptidase [unclassified Sphingopyxis]USI77784.1 dipeptidase [Sphingopyxis sp. USTB-05]
MVERHIVVDMLAPLRLDFSVNPWDWTLTEEERKAFRAGGVDVLHSALPVSGPNAHAEGLRYFAGWSGFLARHSDLFLLATDIPAMERARRDGRIAVVLGVQDSEHFRSADDVATFYALGQRCSQLTYNRQNLIGAGSTERVDGGVTDFGVKIIAAMNQAGMLIDVSHCGDRTTLDAIEMSDGPIAITHSNCRSLNDNPRLKTDEAIRKLAAKGGVIGMTGMRNFVRSREPTNVMHIVDHIDHVRKLVGIEHVGVGSDIDLHGYDDMPPAMNAALRTSYKSSMAFRERMDTDGFDHPRRMFDLVEALVVRGYSDEEIEAVIGGNFHRLLAAVLRPSV